MTKSRNAGVERGPRRTLAVRGENFPDGGAGTTRRRFLTAALAIGGWSLTNVCWRAVAQPRIDPPKLIKLAELRSQGGKLKGVLMVRSGMWIIGDNGAGVAPAERGRRYFAAKDLSGNEIWPPANTVPLPGPTLRARVGDRVELTLLNHIDIRDFGKTGIDREGCDPVLLDDPPEVIYPGQTGDGAPNCFHGSSTINMHFHGTHVTPDGLGDNVLLQLRPDRTVTEADVAPYFKMIFDNGPPEKYLDLPPPWRGRQEDLLQKYDRDRGLPPASQLWPPTKERIDKGLWPQYQIGAYPYCYDLTKYTEDAQGKPDRFQMGQCPGTHWYHAHKHGSTAINVLNGLVGVFVIEGDYDDMLEKFYPDLRKTEQVLVIHNIGDSPNMAQGNIRRGNVFSSPTLLVNGQVNPTIVMQPGEIQLWRLVNATIKAVTTIEDFAAIHGDGSIDFRQTAQDGVQFSYENFVAQPILKFLNTGKPRPASFAPGNRLDLLVKAPTTAGLHQFRLNDTADLTSPIKDVLTVSVVEGSAVQMDFPGKDDYPKFPRFLGDIQANDTVPGEANPARRRTVDFGWDPKKTSPGPDGGKAPQLVINGKKFDGHNYDQEMVLNAVEEWTLTNSTGTIRHPFHIHVNPFQVVEIFDPDAGTTYQPSGSYIWQDVIAIPPATFNPDGTVKEKGRITIRHRFVDFAGSYVLHCHMLSHEDRGMMQLVRVVPTAADLGTEKAIPHH